MRPPLRRPAVASARPGLRWLPSERTAPGDTHGVALISLDADPDGADPSLPAEAPSSWAFPLSVTWAPQEPWRPTEPQRLATRDFRRGYPMTWDLEVPMRTVSRPFQLRPGIRRQEPPPSAFELQGGGSPTPAPEPRATRAEAPTPDAASKSSAPPPSVPKGSRMKGWSKAAAWSEEDPWAKRP